MDERTMKPIADALDELLKERGMTQTDLWAAAGLDSSTVSLYVNGKRGAVVDWRGAQTIERMAQVFDLAPSYFIEYRMWQLREVTRKYPALAERVYDSLIALARSVGDNVSSATR